MGFKSLFSGKGTKNRSVYQSWFISYIILIIALLLIFSTTYLEAKRIIDEEIADVNRVLLKQVQISMDNAMFNIHKLVYQTGLNNKLNSLINKSINEKDIDRVLLQEVLKNFLEYKRDVLYVEDFFIYMKDMDMVLSSSGLREAAFIRIMPIIVVYLIKNGMILSTGSITGIVFHLPESLTVTSDSTSCTRNRCLLMIFQTVKLQSLSCLTVKSSTKYFQA